MTNDHFGDFVASFEKHEEQLAMTMRPFLKLERIHYGELQRRCVSDGPLPLVSGIALGDRVMVVANNSPHWVEVFLGAQLVGAILVPTDSTASSRPP